MELDGRSFIVLCQVSVKDQGAGMDSELVRKAALESYDEIEYALMQYI